MKREFYKVIRSKTVQISVLIALIFSFAFGVFYYSNSVSTSKWHCIEKYTKIEELQTKIENCEKQLKLLDEEFKGNTITYDEYLNGIDEVKITINIYKYLQENNLEYFKVAEESAVLLYQYSDNKIAFCSDFISLVMLLSLLFGAILSILLNTYEADKSVSKLVYCGVSSRMKILFKKLLVSIICNLALTLILVIIMLCLMTTYSLDFSILIIVNGQTVKSMSATGYLICDILMNIFMITLFNIIFFFISVLSKNIYLVICLLLLSFALVFVMITFINIRLLQCVVALLITGLVAVLSSIYFNKKDLC